MRCWSQKTTATATAATTTVPPTFNKQTKNVNDRENSLAPSGIQMCLDFNMFDVIMLLFKM
jgi:hypothetical protein